MIWRHQSPGATYHSFRSLSRIPQDTVYQAIFVKSPSTQLEPVYLYHLEAFYATIKLIRNQQIYMTAVASAAVVLITFREVVLLLSHHLRLLDRC